MGFTENTIEGTAHRSVTVVAHDVATLGGMERQLGELCTGLLARGYRVTVIAGACGLSPHPLLRVIRVRFPRRPFSIAYPAFFLLGTMSVRRHRDGLVHTTGAVVANSADASTVHFCHHGFRDAVGVPQASRPSWGYRLNAAVAASMSRSAERFCFSSRRTRTLVAVSGGVARELERLTSRHPRRRPADIAVIANGVDRARFVPDPDARAKIRRRLGIATDDLVAIFVGGDWDRKGLQIAIEAVAVAGNWRLVVVGEGDEGRYAPFAQGAGAGGRVHFAGRTSEPERYYASADAFLFPTAYEAFPLVALEAAAAGLPLIAGHVSGIEELVDEGKNGWCVPRDGAAIAERLRVLGTDPALRDRMGRAARESSAGYTWDRMVDAYVKLYEELASAERPATR